MTFRNKNSKASLWSWNRRTQPFSFLCITQTWNMKKKSMNKKLYNVLLIEFIPIYWKGCANSRKKLKIQTVYFLKLKNTNSALDQSLSSSDWSHAYRNFCSLYCLDACSVMCRETQPWPLPGSWLGNHPSYCCWWKPFIAIKCLEITPKLHCFSERHLLYTCINVYNNC